MRQTLLLWMTLWIWAIGCGGAQQSQSGGDGEVPPFELRKTAWKIMIDQYPDLSKIGKQAENKMLDRTLTAFYKVVSQDPNQERDTKQKRQRSRSCKKAWSLLTQQSQRRGELRQPLKIARVYVGVECGMSRKSLPGLRRMVKSRDELNFVYYSARFWYGETLLELERTDSAVEQYRWILGELESPLYPLALLRTAHCHWDSGEVEKAREYLVHVNDWIGTKTQPLWVRSLKRQVQDDLEAFQEE